eukprot:15662318-Heterocapsa_arctica.AAC.1
MTRIGEMSTFLRRSANPLREQFRREYAEIRQEYAETAILTATRSKECAGYSGKETTTPIMEEMNKLIV